MAENNRFRMTAYTGATIHTGFWGRVVFDVPGITFGAKLPALREHKADRPVGVLDWFSKEQKKALVVGGHFVTTPDAKEVKALLAEGYPYQASVGIEFSAVEPVAAGKSAKVNGGAFSGPGIIVRSSILREVSFVSMGADRHTHVGIAAAAASASNRERSYPAMDLEQQAQHQWKVDLALHNEFSSFDSYLACLKAEQRGRLKIRKANGLYRFRLDTQTGEVTDPLTGETFNVQR